MYRHGRVLREPKYVGPGSTLRWLYPVNVNNVWGYANPDGDIAIWFQFQWADAFHDGLARVIVGQRTGFVNEAGHLWVPPVWDWADRYREQHALVYHRGKFGYLNQSGDWQIAPRFSQALGFSQGFAAASLEPTEPIGYIDLRGQWIITPRFAYARSFHENLAVVRLAERQQEKIKSGPLAVIDLRGETKWVDSVGHVQEMGDFRQGWFRIRIGDRWGYMDQSWKVRIEAKYEDARDFHEDFAAAKQHGRWGFINMKGDWIIPATFDQAMDFSDGLAAIQRSDLWGFVDAAGRLRVAPQFRRVEPYQGELARVWFDAGSMFACIDGIGQVYWYPMAATDRVFEDTPKGLVKWKTTRQIPTRQAPDWRPETPTPYFPFWRQADMQELPRPQAWINRLPQPRESDGELR